MKAEIIWAENQCQQQLRNKKNQEDQQDSGLLAFHKAQVAQCQTQSDSAQNAQRYQLGQIDRIYGVPGRNKYRDGDSCKYHICAK